MELVSYHYPYIPMDINMRREILPEHNICSLYPAENYDDAFVTGNGYQQMTIKGDPYKEYIVFSQEALYEPVWEKTLMPPDFTEILPEMRRLLIAGKYEEVSSLIDKEQRRQGYEDYLKTETWGAVSPPPTLFRHQAQCLMINQKFSGIPQNYLRYLDMYSGECIVRWDTADGIWERKGFVSHRHNVFLEEITAPAGGMLQMELKMAAPVGNKEYFPVFYGIPTVLQHPEKCDLRISVKEDMLILSCAYAPAYGNKGYISAVRLLIEEGNSECIKNGVNITDSRRVLLIGKTVKYESAFSHDNITAIEKELREIQPDYRLMAEENRNYLSKKLELSRFRFGSEQEYAYSTEELLREQHLSGRVNPVLLDKFYDLGRFYLITDTGNLPPAWGQHNINTNLQVCAGNMAGLDREMDIYFRFYENKFEDFRTNARRLFGARGMLAPIHCDYDSGLSYHFSRTSPQFAWTGCLGWIYNELWGYYLVTGDLEFLRERVVPGLKEIALFFEDYACDRDENGKTVFYPSFSPENAALDPNTGEGAYPTAINAVMDIMICREILDNLLAACRELGIEQENIPHWEKQKSCLPPFLLDEEGGLKEWAWADIRENYKHRHVSHHYDAWPGHRANWEETPELASAILISNRKRAQQDDSAHGIIHRLFTAIRLKDKKDAQGYLRQLMEHGFITRSMNTRHYPYAVCWPDLLGAMPAVLMEMAVYSEPGIIEILPAMPETLRSGNVNGIRLYTFARLEELVWDLDKMTAGGRITAIRRQELCLRFRHGRTVFRINGKMADCDENQVYFEAAEGETVDFSMEWV